MVVVAIDEDAVELMVKLVVAMSVIWSIMMVFGVARAVFGFAKTMLRKRYLRGARSLHVLTSRWRNLAQGRNY